MGEPMNRSRRLENRRVLEYARIQYLPGAF